MPGPENIRAFGTTLIENKGAFGTALIENGPTSWFLATFGERAEQPKLGAIPPRGGKALPPSRKIGAHACFTKIGQEP